MNLVAVSAALGTKQNLFLDLRLQMYNIGLELKANSYHELVK